MRVVGISGSPRRGGNSDILLDRVLEGAASKGSDVEKIFLNELNFKPCQECGGCDKTGVCIVRDDMDGVYRKIRNADAVIMASPIFFGSLSAQLKMTIDRFQCSWIAKHVLNKKDARKEKRKGFFLSISGSHRKEFFDNAKSIIKAFFATMDIEYSGELFCGGFEKGGCIKGDEKALNEAYGMGETVGGD